MIRLVLVISVLSILSSGILAQSLELKYGEDVVSNDTVYMNGAATDDLLELHLKVKNLTDKEIEVKIKKNEISILDGSVNTFCWGGSCFLPNTIISPLSTKIQANGTDFNSFAGDYDPAGIEGTSIISYTFFNVQNEDDSVMVTAFYQIGATGINKVSYGSDDVKVFPNPIVDRVNIEFINFPDDQYNIRLLNLNGQVIEELANSTTAKSHSISISGIPSSYAIIEIADSKGMVIRKKVLIGKK